MNWWADAADEKLTLALHDIILGLPKRTDILNYMIILGKLCIWECRKLALRVLTCFCIKWNLNERQRDIWLQIMGLSLISIKVGTFSYTERCKDGLV